MTRRRLLLSSITFLFTLAFLVLAHGQARAQETFRNPAMEEQDEAQKAFNRGRRFARENRFDEAIKEFQTAARLRNNQCAECFQHIGLAYFQMPKLKEAAEAFRQAVALKPANEAELSNYLGLALYRQDDKKLLEEAVTAFKRAIEMSSGKLSIAYYNLGYALMKHGKDEEGRAALKSYLELEPSAENVGEVRAVMANPRLVNEKIAPGFKVTSLGGEELSLDRFKGKIVLLDFWATWCVPCVVEMPGVKAMWKKYGGDNFVIIGVSLDDDFTKLEAYLKKEGIAWPQYFDDSGRIANLYDVKAIPYTVLIDQDGIVRAMGMRGSALSNKVGDLIKKIQKK
jgi:tetratricopeptide (TPR) repeat protein